jgi:hypothetical protein
MPFRFEHRISESGLRYLRADTWGDVTLADGRALEAHLLPGGEYHLGYVISVVAKGTEYSPEVRKFFPSLDDKLGAIAAVVTSPIVRAGINTMLRIGGNSSSLRMFTSEVEALVWLETQAAQNANKRL